MIRGLWNHLTRPPSALRLAVAELENAKRERLVAETGAEYAKALAAYNAARIERLQRFIAAESAS